jgi:GntR family transcriptional repressor for pyruvate dehydrogenase complex
LYDQLTIIQDSATLSKAMLKPIPRQSLSDAVFAQLRDQIVSGALAPGARLPAERVLCEQLGVNRGAVREALRKLEQARLVSIRHGGTSRVLDFRTSAGMDLLVDLLVSHPGPLAVDVVRSIVEMRSALGPDVARLAASRRTDDAAEALARTTAAMRAADGDLAKLQELGHAFWTQLVAASGNVAYQLAFNTLREIYERSFDAMRGVLADELTDVASYESLADAVRSRDAAAAESGARRLVRRGEARIAELLDRIGARAVHPAPRELDR